MKRDTEGSTDFVPDERNRSSGAHDVRSVEGMRLSVLMFESPLDQVARLGVDTGNLLITGVKITPNKKS